MPPLSAVVVGASAGGLEALTTGIRRFTPMAEAVRDRDGHWNSLHQAVSQNRQQDRRSVSVTLRHRRAEAARRDHASGIDVRRQHLDRVAEDALKGQALTEVAAVEPGVLTRLEGLAADGGEMSTMDLVDRGDGTRRHRFAFRHLPDHETSGEHVLLMIGTAARSSK